MTTDLVQVEPLLPMSPDVARAAMKQYHELTAAMLVDDDWQQIPNGRFVKRSGFQKIASGYGVSTEITSEVIERDDVGQPVRASAMVRATHPSGRYADGSGRCSLEESRFKSSNGRGKAEHDIAATAVTRATNRAISNLVGFGQVSAEEVDGAAPTTTAAPSLPWGPVATDEQMSQAANLVRALAAPTDVDGEAFILAMGQHFDGIPVACVTMLRGLQRFISTTRSEPENAPPPAGQGAYEGVSAADVYPPGRNPGD